MDINDEIIEYELKYCQNLLLQEICLDLITENIKNIFHELTDGYLRSRPIPPEYNPLVNLIDDICNEYVETISKTISKECINETVSSYLEQRYVNHCYDAIESALFTEELTKIAQDEIFNEFALKLQARFLSHWVDHEMIPEIVRECRNELLSHQEEELNMRDRTIQRHIAPQLVIMHLIMSMMSSFDTVMINHFTKGIMKRLVVHRLLSVMYGLESRVNHVIENEVEQALFERLVLPTLQDEFIQHLLVASLKREDDIDFIESQMSSISLFSNELTEIDEKEDSNISSPSSSLS